MKHIDTDVYAHNLEQLDKMTIEQKIKHKKTIDALMNRNEPFYFNPTKETFGLMFRIFKN